MYQLFVLYQQDVKLLTSQITTCSYYCIVWGVGQFRAKELCESSQGECQSWAFLINFCWKRWLSKPFRFCSLGKAVSVWVPWAALLIDANSENSIMQIISNHSSLNKYSVTRAVVSVMHIYVSKMCPGLLLVLIWFGYCNMLYLTMSVQVLQPLFKKGEKYWSSFWQLAEEEKIAFSKSVLELFARWRERERLRRKSTE